MDPEKQIDVDNPDRDTDFKQLMLKLKVDDAKYTKINEGPVVSIIYRLNGVKVHGEDLETYVCDFIEMKKNERADHERAVARANADNAPAPPTAPQKADQEITV